MFSDCRAGSSKEPQWESDRGSFPRCFLLVYTSSWMDPKVHENNIWGQNLSHQKTKVFHSIMTKWNLKKIRIVFEGRRHTWYASDEKAMQVTLTFWKANVKWLESATKNVVLKISIQWGPQHHIVQYYQLLFIYIWKFLYMYWWHARK